MPAYPSRLVQVAFGKESSYGAGGSAALLIPVDTVEPSDVVGLIADDSWRSAPASSFGHVVGSLESELKLAGPVKADGIGFLLEGVLGDGVLAAGSPNTWTFALLNSGAQQPPSYAVTVADPIGQLQWPGCKVASLALDFQPDSLIGWEAELAGLPSAASAVTVPAASAETVLQGWAGVATIGGSVSAQVLSAQVKIARAVTSKSNVSAALTPWLQRSDLLTVTGTVQLAASTDTLRQQWQNGTATSIDLAFSAGAGAALRKLQVHCSSVTLTNASRSYGSRWVELSAAFIAEANATDVGASGGLSPVKVTLKNTVGAGVYS